MEIPSFEMKLPFQKKNECILNRNHLPQVVIVLFRNKNDFEKIEFHLSYQGMN